MRVHPDSCHHSPLTHRTPGTVSRANKLSLPFSFCSCRRVHFMDGDFSAGMLGMGYAQVRGMRGFIRVLSSRVIPAGVMLLSQV